MKTKKKSKKRGGTFNRIWWKLTSAKTLAAKVKSALELVNPAQFHKIKNYFHDFLLFDQPDEVQIEWKALASDGKHGNVCVVRYTGGEHQSFALLKQGKAADSDNLMIEYYTGLRLNKFYDLLPVLVYTHGIYTASADPRVVLPETATNFAYVQGFNRKHYLLNKGLKTACDPTVGLNNLILLTQYVENSFTFDSMLYRSPHFDDTWRNDDAAFFPIFFQIIYSLHALNYYTGFKHNDLHSRNILVRTLPRPVEFVFRVAFPEDQDTPQQRRASLAAHRKQTKQPFMQTVPVTFRTTFFAKIIDYGQCTHDETPFDEFKKTPTCKLDRGFNQVFGKKASEKSKDNDFISAYINDVHDFEDKRLSFEEILEFLAEHFEDVNDPPTQLLGTLTVDAFNGNAMVFQ